MTTQKMIKIVEKFLFLLSKKKTLLDDIKVSIYDNFDGFYVINAEKTFKSIEDLLKWFETFNKTNKRFHINYNFHKGKSFINISDNNELPIVIKIQENDLYSIDINITSMLKISFDGYYTHYDILNGFIKQFQKEIEY